MARIQWNSTFLGAASGYGQQTALWTRKLAEMGHEVIISTYWGLSGSPTSWNGITVLPGFGGNYCTPAWHSMRKRLTLTSSSPSAISGCWTRTC